MRRREITHKTGDGSSHPVSLPQLGLGVYQSGAATEQAVLWALELGYRHFDTAAIYRNEADVGRALRSAGVPRGELFITTKLWSRDHGYQTALDACAVSLDKLQLDTVDLYLIHAPPKPALRADTWRAMETLLEQGRTRAIGVSNYGVRHLDEMAGYAAVIPAVNQIELSPYLQRRELTERCRELGIVPEAYAPLTKGQRLGDPRLAAIAEVHGKSPAQVLIRWALEQDTIVIPKSVHRERIAENIDVFDFALTSGDLQTMASWEEGLITSWDPTTDP